MSATPSTNDVNATQPVAPVTVPTLPEKVEVSDDISAVILDFYNAAVAAEQEFIRHRRKFQEFILYTKQKLGLPADAPYGVTPDCKSFVLIKAPQPTQESVQTVEQVEQNVVQAENQQEACTDPADVTGA